MKFLFAMLFALPLSLSAQDCDLKKVTDPLNGKSKVSTGFVTMHEIRLSLDANNKEIDFFFVINIDKAKCVNEESTMTFMFEGGKQKTMLRNSGSMNCDGIFHIIMKNSTFTPSALNRLNSKKIVSLVLTDSNEKETKIDLTVEEQKILGNMISCMITEAKTVL
ncbi:MAG: hypothetical protein H7Y27_16890 [Gemmatimonadaceae bacterium]|nr:hypothetical protein [Chitinophagaceae bacterium]